MHNDEFVIPFRFCLSTAAADWRLAIVHSEWQCVCGDGFVRNIKQLHFKTKFLNRHRRWTTTTTRHNTNLGRDDCNCHSPYSLSLYLSLILPLLPLAIELNVVFSLFELKVDTFQMSSSSSMLLAVAIFFCYQHSTRRTLYESVRVWNCKIVRRR